MMSGDDKFWMRHEPSGTRIGIQPDYAESIPGHWVGIEILPAGSLLRAGDGFGFITTDQGTQDLRAPAEMTILEVNETLRTNANLARLSPTGLGWIAIVDLKRVAKV